MTRGLALAVLGLLLALPLAAPRPADAREEKAKAACLDSWTDPVERVTACTRYLRGGQPPPEEQVRILLARADAYADQDLWDQALADVEAAKALAPESEDVWKSQGYILSLVPRYEDALAAYEQALLIDDKDHWTWYAKGFALVELDRRDEAMAAYSQSIALKPDYAVAIEARGNLQSLIGDFAAAIADWSQVLELEPYRPLLRAKRGELHAVLDDVVEALRDYRVSLLLDPNTERAIYGQERLAEQTGLTLDSPPPLEPRAVAFAPPAPGLTIVYLQQEIDPAAEIVVDPMEEAIGDLVGWFSGPKEKPRPLSSLFVTRRIEGSEGRVVRLAIALAYPALDDPKKLKELAVDWLDGLWPAAFPTPQGKGAEIVYDATLQEVWGLAPGQSVTGDGAVVVTCPAEGVPPDVLATMVGCQPGQTVQIGKLAWTATLVGWEDLLLPIGRTATLRLHYVEQAELTFMGQTKSRTMTTTWWWNPELATWVRRRIEKDGRIEVSEAVKVLTATP
jgi:tetratricopeptide (TPR) repeat protein